MICLDERQIGSDDSTVLVHALATGGAVLARGSSGMMLGAHLPLSASVAEIELACRHLYGTLAASVSVSSLLFVSALRGWRARADRYGRTDDLIADLKQWFAWTGGVWLCDKDLIAPIIDLRLDTNPVPATLGLGCRPTPVPDPMLDAPAASVRIVRRGSPATVEPLAAPHRHRVPRSTSAFAPIAMSVISYV